VSQLATRTLQRPVIVAKQVSVRFKYLGQDTYEADGHFPPRSDELSERLGLVH